MVETSVYWWWVWSEFSGTNTRSDSKVMRLVPKKSFILFIHQLKYSHFQSTSLVPVHTFSSGAAIVCNIPGTQIEECRLRPALQTSGCLLLTQNGVPSLSILFWHVYVLGGVWKKKSRNIVTSSHPVLIRVWFNMMLEQWNLLETLTLTLATYTHVWARNAVGGKGVTEQRYPLRR